MSFSFNDVGQTVSFNVHATGIIPDNFQNCRILSILDAEDAARWISNLGATHASIYPSLPVGSPDNPKGYYYLKLQLANGGGIKVVGIPWIDQATYTVVTGVRTTVIAVRNTSAADTERLRVMLVAGNFTDFDINTQ